MTAIAGRRRSTIARGVAAWVATLLFVSPALWMALTSLHQEIDAVSNPPDVLGSLTFSHYKELLSGGLGVPLINSLTAAVFSTLFVLALAIPAAYALSLRPVPKWRDVLFFFMSTKMMPAIAGLLPIYLIVKDLGLLDNVWTLVALYTSMNLPLAIWMMRSFFGEVPREVMDAAAVDGAGTWAQIRRIVLPLTYPGIFSTALICFIFAWNEFLFAVNLTATTAETTPVFLVGFISGQKLFLAQLCAASVLVSLPVLIAGFVAQDRLVRGLTLGAVK